MNKSEELLEKVNQIIKNEGFAAPEDLSSSEKLDKYIIPGIQNSKNTLAELYKFSPKDKQGFVGKLKNMILGKVKNITLNVVERESMRQQKFNELTYQALVEMKKELEGLKSSTK